MCPGAFYKVFWALKGRRALTHQPDSKELKIGWRLASHCLMTCLKVSAEHITKTTADYWPTTGMHVQYGHPHMLNNGPTASDRRLPSWCVRSHFYMTWFQKAVVTGRHYLCVGVYDFCSLDVCLLLFHQNKWNSTHKNIFGLVTKVRNAPVLLIPVLGLQVK